MAGSEVLGSGQLTAAAWSISLSANTNALSPGGTATLTAYTNMDVGPTPYWIVIMESTNSVFLGSCSSGTTCSVYPNFPYATSRNYLAYVSSNTNPPSGVQATSNYANVTWFAVNLSASATSLVAYSSTTLTASATNDVGPTPYYLEIYDRNTGGRVMNCPSGWQCSVSIQQTSGTSRSYVAYVAGLGTTNPPPSRIATSNIVSVNWAPLSVSLVASAYYVAPSTGVTLTATANTNVGPTPYWMEIFEADTGRYLWQCSSGSSCSTSVSYSTARHSYIAYLSGNSTAFPPTGIGATSYSFYVTWLNVFISTTATYTQIGNNVRITATANTDVGPSPYAIQIYDQDGGNRLAICTSGSSCYTDVNNPQPITRRFVAVIAYSKTTYPPTGIQSNSGTAYITWLSMTLGADQGVLAPNASTTLHAYASVLVQNTPYVIEIFEVGGALLATCTSGSACTTNVSLDRGGTRTFNAYITPYDTTNPPRSPVASGNNLAISWLSISLTASKTSTFIYDSSTLTATTNANLGGTAWDLQIFDQTTGGQIADCHSCSSVSYAASYGTQQSRGYIAYVAISSATAPPQSIQVTSASVSVSWNSVDHLWGVDSADPITTSFIQSIRQYGQLHFFGRYLGPTHAGYYSGLVQSEVDVAHANGIRLLLIDASLGNALTGETNGFNEAVQASKWLHGYAPPAPAGTIIYLDVENSASIDPAFIKGWYDGMGSTSGFGYLAGYYNNPVNGGFAAAFCGAPAYVQQNANLWSTQPNPGETPEASAPAFGATGPSCAPPVTAWQYGIRGNGSIGNLNVDTDEIRPAIFPNMW